MVSRLREKYPDFVFGGYEYTLAEKTLDITYHFEIPGLAAFHPSWSIDILSPAETSPQTLDTLVFSLGMTELISYWKLACSPNIRVNCGYLTQAQIPFWDKLYQKGMGEFYYLNGIDPAPGFFRIHPQKTPPPKTNCQLSIVNCQFKKALVPIGGGKDSAVTLELLRNRAERYGFIINPRKAALDTARAAGTDGFLVRASRTLDPAMLALNAKGFLNGHTPFSAIVAFSSVLAAYINGFENVALSNESSANEATVSGTDINHQYSKSFEFERDFIDYELAHIGTGVKYFSLLRPLNELQIARVFASLTSYHNIFLSCNAGSKTDEWCANCPKCLFVYIILSPFMERGALAGIFGRDMLDSPELETFFDKLAGFLPEKPFECVGSRDEVNAALRMTARKYEESGDALPYLLRRFAEKRGGGPDCAADLLGQFDAQNAVPEYFLDFVKDAAHA
ncbi:MAG: hypothetical protein LBR85_09160 [Oscillospiraceae bacterium]|jgi:hypothetical protein|nr:hypothetical protein [Oscillospiraceae bacterium]